MTCQSYTMSSDPIQKIPRLWCITPRYTHRPRRNFLFPFDPYSTHVILAPQNIVRAYMTGYTISSIRLVADASASAEKFTVAPDLFNGAEVPFPRRDDSNLHTYIEHAMPRIESVDPIIAQTISYLRTEKGVKNLGGVG
ncbi:hypothetical protein BDU57DRAFT_226074 [Ampelomyces quisqualis]|uniref:Uncharacterized protein n=1 Tax=Ampelomyces quisqualis TaxID=50730 RepID=A0A6A5QLG9_AMPQU|nr:hypothetical protein BDU57DRAFT_226074 [Ampelomyces quisqualis]